VKRNSETKVGEALRSISDPSLLVYKPPDDARNWKPCDFMVWWQGRVSFITTGVDVLAGAWIEVKDIDSVETFPLADLRPSQRQGIAAAAEVGMPYYLVVWWRRRETWTISRADRVLAYAKAQDEIGAPLTGILYKQLAGAFGIDADTLRLGQTLKSVIVDGELR
jgi:hypothetical protein